jgi:hypothetical protein
LCADRRAAAFLSQQTPPRNWIGRLSNWQAAVPMQYQQSVDLQPGDFQLRAALAGLDKARRIAGAIGREQFRRLAAARRGDDHPLDSD